MGRQTIIYTKNELAKQRKILKSSERMLPLFEAMEKLLMVTINTIVDDIERIRGLIYSNEQSVQGWIGVMSDSSVDVRSFISVDRIETKVVEIAGVRVRKFVKVHFDVLPIADATPLWVEDAVELMQDQLQLLAEIDSLKKQIEVLDEELDNARARVKLFEKRRIPEAKEAIKKINERLQDDERLSIAIAKVMKTKKAKGVII